MSPVLVRFTVLLSISIATVVPAVAQTPPKDLKLVGDHWTAWDPPASVAEGAEVYVIEQGDTLWDLAEKFYGNAYLWPQIWERNQYILDAHWIYPGDPLVLGIEVETAEVSEDGIPVEDIVGDAEDDARRGVSDQAVGRFGGGTGSAFIQLGTPDDIYCSGYIGATNEQFGYSVVGSEYDVLGTTMRLKQREDAGSEYGASVDTVKFDLSIGDVIYLDGGRAAGLAPGDVFTAVSPGNLIRRPGGRKVLGRYYSYLGRVQVLSVQEDSAIAEITHACKSIRVGSVLKPFVPEPVPSERVSPLRPVNDPPSADSLTNAPEIVYAKDGLVSLGQDHVVFVDLGQSDDVIPGDVFTVYRANRKGNPLVVLGEIAILSVHPDSSVAKVIESRYPMYYGDLLQAK